MMNRILKGLMIMLLFITLLPTQALAVVTPCIDTVFKLTAPVPGDDKLTGEALSDNELTIKIDDQLHKLTVKPDGKYELELPTALTGDEKIEVQQGLNKLEASVEEEPAEKELLLETPFDCTGLVAPSTEEPTTEEPSSEDISTEAPSTEKATTEKPSTEAATTEKPSTEKTTTEAPTTEDVTTEEPSTEQVTTEVPVSDELTTEDVTTEEPSSEAPQSETAEEPVTEAPTSEALSPELTLPTTELPALGTATTEMPTADPLTTEQPVTDAPIIFRPRLQRSFAITANSSVASLTAPCSMDVTAYNANRSAAVTQAVTGNIACVSNATDFDKAVQNSAVEVVILTADITSDSSNVVQSPNGQKVIDANGHSLQLTKNLSFKISSTSNVSNFVIQNATLYNRSGDLVNVEGRITDVRLSDVKYNPNNLESGNLGTGYSSRFHFYNNVDVKVSGPLLDSFIMTYGQIILEENAKVTLSSSRDGINFKTDKFNNSLLDNVGVNLHKGASLDLVVVGDGITFDNNKPFRLVTQEGSKLNINANQGIYIFNGNSVSNDFMFDFEPYSTTTIQAKTNAIRFNQRYTKIDIKDYAQVSMYSSGNQTWRYGQPSNSGALDINAGSGSRLLVQSITNEPISINKPTTYTITKSAVVDFISQSKQVFDSSNFNVRFIINNVGVRSWTSNVSNPLPDKQTPLIANGDFKMSGTTTTVNNSSMDPKFASEYPPTMKRLQFMSAPSGPIPQPSIYDDSAKITGTAEAGSTVTMSNSRNASMQTTTADANGNFAFTVADKSLVKGDILSFTSSANDYTSAAVTRTVIGTVLTLMTPADITFKSTPIQNKPDLLIYRETPSDYSLKVKDTKTRGSWEVTVQATRPMTDTKGNTLSDALVFKEGSTITSLKSAVKVTEKSKATVNAANEYTTTWGPTDGILLRTNPIQASADTYTGTLTWTLTSGP